MLQVILEIHTDPILIRWIPNGLLGRVQVRITSREGILDT